MKAPVMQPSLEPSLGIPETGHQQCTICTYLHTQETNVYGLTHDSMARFCMPAAVPASMNQPKAYLQMFVRCVYIERLSCLWRGLSPPQEPRITKKILLVVTESPLYQKDSMVYQRAQRGRGPWALWPLTVQHSFQSYHTPIHPHLPFRVSSVFRDTGSYDTC